MRRLVVAVAVAVAALAAAGSASAAMLVVSMPSQGTVDRYVKIDVTGTTATGALTVYRHRGSACGATDSDEQRAVYAGARRGPAAPVVQLEGFNDAPGHARIAYLATAFGVHERFCFYFYEQRCPPDDSGTPSCALYPSAPPDAFAERELDVSFAPVRGGWQGGVAVDNIVSAFSPRQGRLDLVGDCGRPQRPGSVGGRRWYLRVRVRADGTFAYRGRVRPDTTSNYDTPIPAPWPTRNVRVVLSGRFLPRNDGLTTISGRATVLAGSAGCGTHGFRLRGGALEPPVPPGYTND
jgi:hypothetical protein